MVSKKTFTAESVTPRLAGAILLLLGGGLLIKPFVVFGYLVKFLPWVLLAVGAVLAFAGFTGRPIRRVRAVIGIVLVVDGFVLLFESRWRDVVLWYGFALLLLFTGWDTLRLAFRPGTARQTFWRLAGGGVALAFGALMLWKPRSGLSDALTLLGIFAVAWGIFLLALPRHRE